MYTKRVLSIVVIVLLVAIMLAACSRSASKAPVPNVTMTVIGNFPSLGKTQVVNQQDAIKTQTAITKQILNPILGAPTETPVPEVGPETPAQQPTDTSSSTAPQPTEAPIVVVNVPTVTPGLPATYTLQEGEHVFCIARRFNVNPDDLLTASGLSSADMLYEGMTLTLPTTGNKFPGDRSLLDHPAKYTVDAGDTIYIIACTYGDVEPWAIAQANNLTAPYKLTAGMVITIP